MWLQLMLFMSLMSGWQSLPRRSFLSHNPLPHWLSIQATKGESWFGHSELGPLILWNLWWLVCCQETLQSWQCLLRVIPDRLYIPWLQWVMWGVRTSSGWFVALVYGHLDVCLSSCFIQTGIKKSFLKWACRVLLLHTEYSIVQRKTLTFMIKASIRTHNLLLQAAEVQLLWTCIFSADTDLGESSLHR